MDARSYSAALDLEQLHVEARHLAHALFCMFASHPDGDALGADQHEAGRHLAWQLVQHTTRLHREWEDEVARGHL